MDPDGKGQKGWYVVIDPKVTTRGYIKLGEDFDPKRGKILNPNIERIEESIARDEKLKELFENFRRKIFPTGFEKAYDKFLEVSASQIQFTVFGIAVLTGNENMVRIYFKMAEELKQGKRFGEVLEKYWVDIIIGAAISIVFAVLLRGLGKIFAKLGKLALSAKFLGRKGKSAVKAIQKSLRQQLKTKGLPTKAKRELVRDARRKINYIYRMTKQRQALRALRQKLRKKALRPRALAITKKKIRVINRQLDRVIQGKKPIPSHLLFSKRGGLLLQGPRAHARLIKHIVKDSRDFKKDDFTEAELDEWLKRLSKQERKNLAGYLIDPSRPPKGEPLKKEWIEEWMKEQIPHDIRMDKALKQWGIKGYHGDFKITPQAPGGKANPYIMREMAQNLRRPDKAIDSHNLFRSHHKPETADDYLHQAIDRYDAVTNPRAYQVARARKAGVKGEVKGWSNEKVRKVFVLGEKDKDPLASKSMEKVLEWKEKGLDPKRLRKEYHRWFKKAKKALK